MNKEQFFANELIISFLHDFQKGLMNLPTSAREQHVLEIKSDLYENALSKESDKHLILCHPLLFLPSIIPSIRVFSNESVFHIR